MNEAESVGKKHFPRKQEVTITLADKRVPKNKVISVGSGYIVPRGSVYRPNIREWGNNYVEITKVKIVKPIVFKKPTGLKRKEVDPHIKVVASLLKLAPIKKLRHLGFDLTDY